MGIEPGRIVRVRTSARTVTGETGTYKFGSGYLIADGLVLTARHVLVPPGLEGQLLPELGQSCEIACGHGDWQLARLEVAGTGDVDAAVLRTEPGYGWPSTRWARLIGADPVAWGAAGFPVAGLGSDRREQEYVYGEVSPLTGDGSDWLGLNVTSRTPRETGTVASGWAGLSGAAVICDDRVAGVISGDPAAYSGSLRALRATAILADPAIAVVLGHPSLVDVGSQPVQRRPYVEPGRRVLLIVDDVDTKIIAEPVSDLAHVLLAENVPEALRLIGDPALRIDAALVDMCIGEETGESGRSVLEALRHHRPRVPRSVISADPYAGQSGDITEVLSGKYGVYKTLKKPSPGRMTPGLRTCVEEMLRQDDEAMTAVVLERINELRNVYVRSRLIPSRNDARRRRRAGGIEETELRDAELRLERAEQAVDDVRDEVAGSEGEAKWEAVAWLTSRLEEISAGADLARNEHQGISGHC